jgi:hypothetical protein
MVVYGRSDRFERVWWQIRRTRVNEIMKPPRGQFPNPNGRPQGAKNRFGARVFEDLATVWEESGIGALRIMAKEHPDRFVTACVGRLPTDFLISVQKEPSALEAALLKATPEEQALISEAFVLIGKLGPRALELLRSEASKIVEGSA